MRKGLFSRERLPLTAVFAAVFLVILVFSFLSPMAGDDFGYCFSWADGSRIRSPLQIPASMAAHRVQINGRVFAHTLVQLMLIGPKAIYNVCNAFNALLLTLLASRFCSTKSRSQMALVLLCGAFLLWNELPAFGQIFLWLDGSINYAWGASFFLLYLLPYADRYLGQEHRTSPLRSALFLILAFVVGAYSENGSLAAIFIAFCLTLLCFLRERRLHWLDLAGLAVAVLGFVFLMTAPATSGRAGAMDVSRIARSAKEILNVFKQEMLPLFLLYGVTLALCLCVGVDRRRILLSLALVLGGLGSLAAFAFALYFIPRHFCFTVIFTVLACLILMAELLREGRKILPALVTGAAAVLFAVNFCLGALDIGVVFLQSREREARIHEALAAGETDIFVDAYTPFTAYPAARTGITKDPDAWLNTTIAQYYGLHSITGILPEEPEA